MLLQFLPKAPERARVADLHPGDAPEGTAAHVVREDDAWVEGRSLIETVEDLELLDPSLSSERLVYRLFHERGVRVFKSVPVVAQCSCSRDSVEAMLRSFSQDDRDHMVENGKISVTCEFCSANYQFAPDDVMRPDGGATRASVMIRHAPMAPEWLPQWPWAALLLNRGRGAIAELSGAARRRQAPGAGHAPRP